MKLVWLTAALAATAFATPVSDVSGRWKVLYAGPPGTAPKTIGSMILDLKVSGDEVTGMVRIGVWPGDAPIADGKIDGDRITFTATGRLDSTSGIPTCRFEVTVHGDDMSVAMTVISNLGGPLSDRRIYEFKGQKISALALPASETDFSGTWSLRYAGPESSGFKTLGSIALDLKVTGNAVTGVAHLASWPGDVPLSTARWKAAASLSPQPAHIPRPPAYRRASSR